MSVTDNKKPTYKEVNGTTRVGDFLRSIGRSDLLEKVFGATKEIITGDVLGAIEKIIGSDELTDSQKAELHIAMRMDEIDTQAVSSRWSSDMTSDSWLSKNIRPLVLGYLVFITTLIAILDSANTLQVAERWITLLEVVLITVIGAYFGSRWHKHIKQISK